MTYNPKAFKHLAIVFRGGPLDGKATNVNYFPFRFKTEGMMVLGTKARYRTAFYEPFIVPDCAIGGFYPIEKVENETLIRIYRFEGFLEGKHNWVELTDGMNRTYKQCKKCGITRADAKADLVHHAECRGEYEL